MQTLNNYDPENEQKLDMESIRKENHSAAQEIFEFLSCVLTSLYNKQQQRYIISFAKHVYRWACISSYHKLWFGQHTNNKKISKLMNSFNNQFNKKYLPPIANSKHFYEIYPSKPLKELINHTKQNCMQSTTVSVPIFVPVRKARKQKILLLMDFDDTLIPTTIIKLKNYDINWKNTSYKERIALDKYVQSLNNFLDTLLSIFDYNQHRNITILTNASLAWVQESMFNSGVVFALAMRHFAEKICNYKIDIISAVDNWISACKHSAFNGFNTIEPYKWKWKIMHQLYKEHFGKKLNGDFDVKIISMGDSHNSEYKGAGVAFNNYLSKQNIHKIKNMKISLHRIKFIENPTISQLDGQLKWCQENIKSIVYNQHKSVNHILKDKI